MSAQTTQPAAPQVQLPNVDQAIDNLFGGLGNEIFFSKCAQAGFVPNTREEAEMMLQSAENLYASHQVELQKRAASSENPFRAVLQASNELAGRYGVKRASDAEDLGALALAERAMQNPTLYNSVLVLKQAQADQARAQLAAA